MVFRGDDAGGSSALADLIDEYGEALEADLGRVYGVGLVEYVTGRRPAREALARIAWLPRGSAYAACRIERHGLPSGDASDVPVSVAWFEWDRRAQMTADLWNITAAAAASKGKPPTYPSPAEKTRTRRQARDRPVAGSAFPALAEAAQLT